MQALPEIEAAIQLIGDQYSPLSPHCAADLKQCARLLHLDKGTLLVREGQLSNKTYFVVTGCARAFYLKSGKDITDWFAFEHAFVSAIHSFFLNAPSQHFIELLEPARLLEISRESIARLSDKHHDFERLGRIIVTKTMLQLQQRIVSIQFEPAQQKYDNLLAIRPDITQRVPLTHIASYLGITLETLSRIRNPKNRI